MSNPYQYPGSELTLFEKATNWKRYFARKFRPHIKGDVLEVGAGIGATTRILNNGSAERWTMLEPDEKMYATLVESKGSLPPNVRIVKGSMADVHQKFDTIIYVDVLEHIADDVAELERAAVSLQSKGRLVVLSPAFQFLTSEFDKAIGHYRRYTKADLKKITPAQLKLVTLQYLDTLGFMASLANKLFLRQSAPSKRQIWFWDKWLIPVSKVTDTLFLYLFGKTVLAVWEKP